MVCATANLSASTMTLAQGANSAAWRLANAIRISTGMMVSALLNPMYALVTVIACADGKSTCQSFCCMLISTPLTLFRHASDGENYNNACDAYSNGVNIAKESKC